MEAEYNLFTYSLLIYLFFRYFYSINTQIQSNFNFNNVLIILIKQNRQLISDSNLNK